MPNIFTAILEGVSNAKQRRDAEDAARQSEEMDFLKQLKLLEAKSDIENKNQKQLFEAKSDIENKKQKQLFEALGLMSSADSGNIERTPVPNAKPRTPLEALSDKLPPGVNIKLGDSISVTGQKPPQTEEEFNTELQREIKKKQAISNATMTTQQKNDIQFANSQLINLNNLEKMSKNIPGGYKGMVSVGISALTRGRKETDTRLYLKQFKAMAAGLYRALTGDNRLSDDDASKRAEPLLWHPSEDASIKTRSFANLRKAFENRIKMIQNKQYVLDQYGQYITPLESVLNYDDKSMESKQTISETKFKVPGTKGILTIPVNKVDEFLKEFPDAITQ